MITAEPEIVGTLQISSQQISSQWTKIKGRLQAEVGDVEYRTWLRQMTLAGLDGDEITVNLPTRFLRDWVSTRYGDRLRVLWQSENPEVRRVDIRVGAAPSSQPAPPETRFCASRTRVAKRPRRRGSNRRVLPWPSPPRDGRTNAPNHGLIWPRHSIHASRSRALSSANQTNLPMHARGEWLNVRPARASIRCSFTAAWDWAKPT